MGTYVPQRVAKLSRAISRLQRRNVGGRKRSASVGERNKKTRKGEEKRNETKVRAAEARESGGMR